MSNMALKIKIALLAAILLAGTLPLFADEARPEVGNAIKYFVSLDGDDENDGLSRAAAFATVQHGVDALSPGDTLTIISGEYFESISRADLGGLEADTVIRAAIPGTVVIRGDVPVPEFRKVAGYRNVYVTDFDTEAEIQTVLETETLIRLTAAPHFAELDFFSGRFFYDSEESKLYISSPDLAPATDRFYTVSLSGGSGISLSAPRRVRLEGLVVTGFGGSGISLSNPGNCVISDCRAYLNGTTGITINHSGRGQKDAGDNVIERCLAWGNIHGINVYGPHGEIIRDSQAFLNSNRGINLYAHNQKEMILEDNLAWGNGMDYRGKTFGSLFHSYKRNVGPGNWDGVGRHAVSHSLIGNVIRSSRHSNNIMLSAEDDLVFDAEFADPANRDYRLQATSRFRGAGENGADLGLPYEANIFYVSPEGDDQADGLSVQNAWATLARAVDALAPGDTLYILSGRYEEDLVLNAGEPDGATISIRGRGTETVEIAGKTQIKNSHNLTFERLDFSSPVAIAGGGGLTFEQCAFISDLSSQPRFSCSRLRGAGMFARNVNGLRVTHCEFSGDSSVQLQLSGCEQVFLAGNRFDNISGTAVSVDDYDTVLYADYNAYRNSSAAWLLKGEEVSFENLPGIWERYGTAGYEAEAVGLYGRPAGNYLTDPGVRARVDGPFIHAVGATSANVEWYLSRDAGRTTSRRWEHARVKAAWGETPECDKIIQTGNNMFVAVIDSEPFGGFSLTGLEPDTQYYVCLRSIKPFCPEGTDVKVEWNSEPVSFKTAADYPEPVTLHVSPKGDDGNSGLTPGRALRTLYRAAELVRPGDTVRIGGGVYRQRLPVRATGTPERPITFAAVPGERVEIDGGGLMGTPIVIQRKSHLRFDGLFLKNIITRNVRWDGAIRIFSSEDIQLSRIFFDGRHRVWSPPFIHAAGVRDLSILNSVGMNSWAFSPCVYSCRGGFRMENSVVVRNQIGGALIHAGVIRNNIFTDCNDNKITVPIQPFNSSKGRVLENNAHVLRPERELHQSGSSGGRPPIPIGDVEEWSLRDGGLTDNPRFAVLYADGNEPGGSFPVLNVMSTSAFPELTFSDLFATNPEFVERGIGLDPEAFRDFYPEDND